MTSGSRTASVSVLSVSSACYRTTRIRGIERRRPPKRARLQSIVTEHGRPYRVVPGFPMQCLGKQGSQALCKAGSAMTQVPEARSLRTQRPRRVPWEISEPARSRPQVPPSGVIGIANWKTKVRFEKMSTRLFNRSWDSWRLAVNVVSLHDQAEPQLIGS